MRADGPVCAEPVPPDVVRDLSGSERSCMTTEGLRDTPPSGRKKGRITIVGEFARGAPSWTYEGLDRYDAIEHAENWLRSEARSKYRTGSKKLEALHAIMRDSPIDQLKTLWTALTACPVPMKPLVDEEGLDDFFWPMHVLLSAFSEQAYEHVLRVLLADPRVKAAVDKPNPQGWTALSWCVVRARPAPDVVRVLCAHGANPNQTIPLFKDRIHYAGRTLLEHALSAFQRNAELWDLVRVLLAYGAQLDVPDIEAIPLGAVTGHIPWITQGLQAGMDVNAPAPKVYQREARPLEAAVVSGNLAAIRALLAAGASVDAYDSLLVEAIAPRFFRSFRVSGALSGREIIAVVDVLLEHNANVRARHRDTDVFDALAFSEGLSDDEALELAQRLTSAGALPSPSALRRGIEWHADLGLIKALLAVGCDPYAVDDRTIPPQSAMDKVMAHLHGSDGAQYAEIKALFDQHILEAVVGGAPSKPAYKRARKGGL
jgi:hypothetical protein